MASRAVVCIGWYGSKPRHCEKFVEVIKKLQVLPSATHYYINPCPGTLSFLTFGWINDAKKIANQVKNEKELIVHVQSNRGMLVYLSLLRILPEHMKIVGVVIDSAPGSLNPLLFVKASLANTPSLPGKALIITAPILAMLAMYHALSWKGFALLLAANLFVSQLNTTAYLRSVVGLNQAPALFVYSDSDELVDAAYVKDTIHKLKQNNIRVEALHLKDSKHVAHYKEHPVEYEEALRSFLQSI